MSDPTTTGRDRLLELCSLIRSKNAGPFELTFDFMARDENTYRELRDSHLLSPSLFTRLFAVDQEQVTVFAHEAALAIKVSMPRPVVQGSLADADCYGGQQYALVLDALDSSDSRDAASCAHGQAPSGGD
jgi:hypothetical protein